MNDENCEQCLEDQKKGYTHCPDCGEALEQRKLPQNYYFNSKIGTWEYNVAKAAEQTAENE